jgi:hypothetical protein
MLGWCQANIQGGIAVLSLLFLHQGWSGLARLGLCARARLGRVRMGRVQVERPGQGQLVNEADRSNHDSERTEDGLPSGGGRGRKHVLVRVPRPSPIGLAHIGSAQK